MSGYTPTTEEVRMCYGDIHCKEPDGDHANGCAADVPFDAWLAEIERAAAEKAWDEGNRAGHSCVGADMRDSCHEENPYRAALGLTAGQEGEN